MDEKRNTDNGKGPMKKKREVEKGILGVPKKQMLFSFNVRHGEEWSSDSEDSDYLPSDEEVAVIKRKSVRKIIKKSKKKDFKEKIAPRRVVIVKSGHHVGSSNASLDLPEELLLKIFQLIVDSQGALPFLVRASRVCSTWRSIASDPSLWKIVDLSYGWIKSTDATLKWLCENRLSQCRDISLSSWKNLTNSNIKNLSESCQHLGSVNLSHCKKITSDSVITLAENSHQLSSLDLSFTLDAVTLQCLKVLLPKHGPKLKQLNVSGNTYRSFISIFNLILSHCPLLELLDISNCTFSTDIVLINVKKFQESCPNLQILGLANSRLDGVPISVNNRQAQLSSFSKLEQLSVAYNKPEPQPKSCLGLDFVTRILHDSPELKLLDIRGNSNMDCHDLCDLNLTNLQSLHASNTNIKKDGSQHYRLASLFHQLRNSLVELDLSWSCLKEEDLYVSLRGLIEVVDSSPLTRLNLAGTNVTEEATRELLNKCNKLKYVNLTSCRGMTRGFKREFQNEVDVSKLRKNLNQSDGTTSDSDE